MNQALSKYTSDGAATAVNIQRHPSWPFQDRRMVSADAPSGTVCAIDQLTICAARIPTTMASWFSETRRPRHWAGLISAIYIGDRLDAMPMATPPTIRQATKAEKSLAQPL